MTRTGRLFAGVAWLFVACVVVQFFAVGLRIFKVEPWTGVHADLAYTYGWLSPALVLLAVATNAPARVRRLALALLCLFAIQTFLPLLKQVAPWIAAVHAVSAFAVAWAAIALARAASSASVPTGSGRRADDGGTRRPDDGGIELSEAAEEIGLMRIARMTAATVAWIFVGAVLLQVFLAGVGVFGAGTLDGHRGFGYLIPLAALIQFLLLAGARARGTIGLAALVLVLSVVQIMLAWARLDAPFVAALHPVNALVIGILGFVIARRATALARATEAAPGGEPAPRAV